MSGLRVVSVTSGKGGVGKTHLAANVATLLARGGERVLAIDADQGLANLDLVLGVAGDGHVGDVLDGAALDEVLLRTDAGVTVLPGAPGLRRLAHLDAGDRQALVAVWEALAGRFDWVVVDAGPGVNDDALFFAATGQQVLLLVTDEPTCLEDAAILLATLSARAMVKSAQVVVNWVRTDRHAELVFMRLSSMVADLPVRLSHLGHVPDDQNLRRAAMLRKPLVELAPTSPAARAFERITTSLRARPAAPVATVSVGLFHQLAPSPVEES